MNSLMQFKGHDMSAVQMGTSDDILWVPEIGKIYFPSKQWLVDNSMMCSVILWLKIISLNKEKHRIKHISFGTCRAHYTDVADMLATRRRKLLGKASSVPVVKHLLAPLRQFFTLKT